ncbi:MAG: hypothetical protein JKY56_09510 [Kofleriaceae bacterium]|nr:hypothetical protein [Kofleriaceae bacterium]
MNRASIALVTSDRNSRWKTFAGAIAAALGVNLWVSLVLLPSLLVGGETSGLYLLALLAPVPLLAFGIWRHNEVVLLWAFPTSLLITIAIKPGMASMQIYGPARLGIVGISLVVFLFGASTLTSFHELPAPRHIRPLKSSYQGIPTRWRRRFRMYASLSLLSLIFPLVLLYHVNFDEVGALALKDNYPGRAATFTTLLNVFVIGLWVVLFANYILSPLKKHRTGDKPLRLGLAMVRHRAKLGNPSIFFYLGGVAAMVLMVLWFALQS